MAGGSGLAVGGIVFWILYRIFSLTHGSAAPRSTELINTKAEVLTAIPSEGLGEVVYILKGTRYNSPARSVDRKRIPAHAMVIIEKVAGNVLFVKESEK
jgi:membrane protein implicated in regulation of membrane protease activity